ncbi:SDR family NAD(P)-dependent oxidoreductase (plasmid) [Sphingobium sp. SJ10-10]|uniref:3-hydroxyacyl-CoA dehydrogenase n=1 Tax=Sphingomonas sp. NS2 TaxID=908605 RepID=A0A0D4ZYY7_9SPHN|nr:MULTISPECIES: SDR family NAD(P)-dependent oxidoreductase [unclassified Sphingobium]AJW29364.1 3-hydroxyacyl-CoA dehydrogenase [Sphingomonas sp. NS2]AMK26566.1 short-chain dehydrogenase/reductase SDR [Sphingobium sp. TKS]MEC6699586.1 SDR family NAD(P)-dependent oxidoreductase [Sphingobium sp. SJ10-10]NML91724.1 SDR family NAD(P)-dependent oxidoreductase [Sphingobium sp. TB-6]
MKIDGLTALVTGGASGLGAATAAMLAAEGAKVTILDRDREAGDAHARAIEGRFIPADVTDASGIEAALAEAEAAFGTARILVNCAGIAPGIKTVGRDGTPHPLDDFRRAVEINLIGTFNALSQFAARLVAAEPIGEERGVIVNTASVAAFDGQIGQAAYAASKSGVVGLTLPVARDLAREKIRVMTIAPGIFMTPMMKAFPQSAQDSLGQQVPHPSRLGQPYEYADLVRSIIVNPMLNGEVIRLDGAIRMGPR